ncbi:MAG: 1-acyl-sn-glycerol-3-phosphate acyltransferase, partial [Nitrospira sp.]|nr:1-acyl-sn-glycerol-3-phosphate acyltransferase [Nitrospira sp.]
MRISRTGCLTRIHRGIRLAGKLVEAVILIWVIFPRSESSSRDGMVERWCRQVLDILQIHLTVHGEAPRGRNSSPLFVANHISWIDVLLLHSCRRMRFVAKREVECWPLIGYLAAGTGTWFFKRTSPHELARVMQAAATALKEGDCVAFFPEGTTTDGTAVHAFHSGLFEAAIKAKARIQPVCIRYEQTDGTTDRQ